MKTLKALLLCGIVLLAASSCSNKFGSLSADNFTITPSPLETHAGQVSFTINGNFPEKYMKKKAVVTVTPMLSFARQEVTASNSSATFQGESVADNYQTISYRLGGTYTMRTTFAYQPEMLESELYMTFKARVGKKEKTISNVKVADGVIATPTLLSRTLLTSKMCIAPDAYRFAIQQTQEAQIKYLIQQTNIRSSELQSSSVQEFVALLREIKADQKGFAVDNIEVSAYASPDGKYDLNRNLAEGRQRTSSQYLQKQLSDIDLEAGIDTRYTAEDWDGFQQLVQASNIQDKEVILRVLSMYEDPEEREQQIKNLSAAFTDLADEILPELRRARITIHYNVIGRTDDEIQEQYAADPTRLSIEEILYAATLTDDAGEQEKIYVSATQNYPNDYRAYNNLAALHFAKGDINSARIYLEQATQRQSDAPEVNVNRALIALSEGRADIAETYLAVATTATNYNEVLGHLQIAQGNYAQASQNLVGVNSNTAALAHILNQDYSNAARTFQNIKQPDGLTFYLQAILAVRSNHSSAVPAALSKAIAIDSSWKTYAAKDLEFASCRDDNSFKSVIR